MNKYLANLKNNKIIAVILIIGIVFMLIPSGTIEKKEENKSADEYAKKLSEDLEEILSTIDGAGEVRVMITLEDEGQIFPVTDVNGNGENIQEKTVSVSGELAVMKKSYPKVRGVAISASGAGKSSVKEDILCAARVLTGVEVHNIKVFRLKK